MMLRFARWTRSCHTQVSRSSKRRPAAKKRALAVVPPQTFREAADRALGIENPELSGDRELAKMTVEAERMMAEASQGQRSTLFVMNNDERNAVSVDTDGTLVLMRRELNKGCSFAYGR